MRPDNDQSGFTLLEIVITVVITAILSAIVLQAMGSNIQRSATPLINMRSNLALHQVMENLTADYKSLFLTHRNPIVVFQNRIMANNTSDGAYWMPFTSFTAQINSVEFNTISPCDGAYTACFEEQACTINCSNYRVTVTQTSTGHSLSTLFSE